MANNPLVTAGDFTVALSPFGPCSSERGTRSHFEVWPPAESSLFHGGQQVVDKHFCTDDISWVPSYGLLVLLDDSQQGLQPHHIHFTVAVQQHQNFSCSMHGLLQSFFLQSMRHALYFLLL